MKCYIFDQTAEHSCKCSVPNILICSTHLKDHKAEPNRNHDFYLLGDVDELALFNKITDQLKAFANETILNAKNQINQIEEETKKNLLLFDRIIQNLSSKYLKRNLNKLLLKETKAFIVYDIDLQKFNNFMKNYNDQKNIEIMLCDNEYLYIGECENEKKNGRGIIKYIAEGPRKGDIYEGEFKNDLIEGKGIYKIFGEARKKGDIYEGEFKNGSANGTGVYKYLSEGPSKGNIYEGEFKDNKREGKGVYQF